MPLKKRSFSLDPKAAEYLELRAKRLKRSVSAVLSELVVEAAQFEARDRDRRARRQQNRGRTRGPQPRSLVRVTFAGN
jgi:hypothetical protein